MSPKMKIKIRSDLLLSQKQREENKTSTLRMLLADIINKEKQKRLEVSKESSLSEEEIVEKSQLSDSEILDVISSQIRERKEAFLAFEKGQRLDLAEKEKSEMQILLDYMPPQLSIDEIKKMAEETISKFSFSGLKDMGKAMREIMPKIKGRADGSEVSKVVKDLLQK